MLLTGKVWWTKLCMGLALLCGMDIVLGRVLNTNIEACSCAGHPLYGEDSRRLPEGDIGAEGVPQPPHCHGAARASRPLWRQHSSA